MCANYVVCDSHALVVISADPDAGELLPGDNTGPQLRQYVDDVERVRLVYWVTEPFRVR
ncbi:hypothetical protein [Streptomyces cyaneofuscatus]|uniref:hypothetical protein n=1 Tax=Streptomyces cyaneofuscatus TaxID=66883 RepID=UPI0036CB5B11